MEKKPIGKWLLLIAYTVLLFGVLVYIKEIAAAIQIFFSVLRPFIYGIVIAFVLNLLLRFLEKRAFARLNRKDNPRWLKMRRPICLLLSLIIAGLIVTFIVVILVPQFVESITMLFRSLPDYANSVAKLVQDIPIVQELGPKLQALASGNWQQLTGNLGDFFSNIWDSVLAITVSVTSGIFSTLVGFILSIYMLANKERLIGGMKRFVRAVLPERFAGRTLKVASLTNQTFNQFFAGQLLECVIIGVLCYIGVLILRMPYGLLISATIAIANIIPIFGPILGTIPCALIILAIKPMKALIFLVFIIVLQQVEGNVIYPRVVGTHVGLSAIGIIFAVIVGGGLFGVAGVLVGIPLLAVCSKLLKEYTKKKLEPTPEPEIQNDVFIP